MIRKIGKTALFATIVATVLLAGTVSARQLKTAAHSLPRRLRDDVQCDRALRRTLHMLERQRPNHWLLCTGPAGSQT